MDATDTGAGWIEWRKREPFDDHGEDEDEEFP